MNKNPGYQLTGANMYGLGRFKDQRSKDNEYESFLTSIVIKSISIIIIMYYSYKQPMPPMPLKNTTIIRKI